MWCRTTDIHTFNGVKITTDNMPAKCMCSDCNRVLQVYPRSDGTFFIRRHKVKFEDRYLAKLEFEKQLKKVKLSDEKEKLLQAVNNIDRLYGKNSSSNKM
jgi:hypothetical protein